MNNNTNIFSINDKEKLKKFIDEKEGDIYKDSEVEEVTERYNQEIDATVDKLLEQTKDNLKKKK